MSRCAVRIELAGSEAPLAGGRLCGVVHVQSAEPIPSKAVLLELRWRVRGRGNPGSLVVHAATLHQGPLPGTVELPFDIPLPQGPLSFAGANMQLDWVISARVDIDWAIDPTCELEFPLRAGPPSDLPYVHGSSDLLLGPDSITSKRMSIGVAGLILGAVALFIGLPCVVRGLMIREWPLVAFGSIFLAIPLVAFFQAWRLPRRLAERRIGQVRTEVQPLLPCPGQPVRVRLSTTPPGPVRVESVSARLVGAERYTRGTGKNRRTQTQPFHQQRTELLPELNSTLPGAALAWRGDLILPRDAIPSFTETDNQVVWTIEIQIRIAGGLDWSDVVTLGVVPFPAR